jgi:hypothetical protein
MNCETLQRRLLKAEHPTRLPAQVQAHLASCPACREWQRQLVQLEEYVGHLPVPPSTAKTELVRLLSARSAAASGPAAARSWNWRLPAGLAAAVLLLAIGSWLLYLLRPASPPGDNSRVANRPLLDNLLERDLRLANAATQRERVEALADLADDLQGETRELALDAEVADLETLSQLYGQVVRDGILARAEALPAAERREVLRPIADRLLKAGKAADTLAQEVTSDVARPLKAIAQAAGDGHGKLQALLQEDKP